MFRALAFIVAVALLGATDIPTQTQYFAGTWKCGTTTWAWRAPSTESQWLQNVYGDPAHPDGTAVFGYVAGLHAWIYRDFHADGSYADLTSVGPTEGGRWQFTGPYYPADGRAPLQGRITYLEVTHDRYDRTFESLEAGAFVNRGGDRCDRQAVK